MYSPDAIETINFEQLVTVTDRLLLRGGAAWRRARARAAEPTELVRRAPARWRRFAITALVTGLCSVTAAIALL